MFDMKMWTYMMKIMVTLINFLKSLFKGEEGKTYFAFDDPWDEPVE